MSEDEIAAVLHTDEVSFSMFEKLFKNLKVNADKADEETVTWYHRGPIELRMARVSIADFSLRKAKLRLDKAREEAARPAHEKALARQEAHKWVQQINLHASQVADTRPVAFCEFSADSEHIGLFFLSRTFQLIKNFSYRWLVRISGSLEARTMCSRN